MKKLKYLILFILVLLLNGNVNNREVVTNIDLNRNVMEGIELPKEAGYIYCGGGIGTFDFVYFSSATTIPKGESKSVKATVKYCNSNYVGDMGPNATVTYSSSNSSVVSCTSDGTITALKFGTVTITASASYNGNHDSRTKTVTVVTGVTGFEFDEDKYTVKVGNSISTSYSVATHLDNLGSVSYGIADTSIATVNNSGVVTGVSGGTTTLTVSGSNGDSTTVPIEVIVPITEVVPTNAKEEYSLGESLKLEYTLSPANATPRDITWKSSDPGVATVSEDGTVTIISPGEATISVETEDGDEFEVTTIRVASASNNAVDPGNQVDDNNVNNDTNNKDNKPKDTSTVDNPSTGLFISLICGFGLCFVIIICHYISKHFRKIRRI